MRKRTDYSGSLNRIADGYAARAQNLALFAAAERSFLTGKSMELSSATSTLHPIAFNIAIEDVRSEKERLERLGLTVQEVEHGWVHVRSLYFADPEGNTPEFVARDESVS